MAVEHRLNGCLSMRLAAVGQLAVDKCFIARPDPKYSLTACMRKLLTILNAMVKCGTPWRVTVSQPA